MPLEVSEVIGKLLAAALLVGSCQIAMSEPTSLETGTVPDGVPIFYQIYGSAEGSPVLLIHGFGGFFDEVRFERTIEFFSNYKLIGIDVRGHGRSGKPSQPNAYGLALIEDLNRLLDHLNLADAHIIGVSMGGIVGLKYATLYPNKVRSLTLVGQGLVPPENYQRWVEMGKAVMESSERTVEQEENLHMYSGFLSGYPPLLVSESEARSLDVPLLIVIGESDERLQSARNLKKAYPATKLIVAPGYDHFTIMDRDSPFYLAIAGFLLETELL